MVTTTFIKLLFTKLHAIRPSDSTKTSFRVIQIPFQTGLTAGIWPVRTVLLIRKRGLQQVDDTTVQYKRSLLLNIRNVCVCVCVALNNAARPGWALSRRWYAASAVGRSAREHKFTGAWTSSSSCCALLLGGSAGIFLLCTLEYRAFLLSQSLLFPYLLFRRFPCFARFSVLLVRATCRWRWVWSVGGMELTGETEVLGEKHVTVWAVDGDECGALVEWNWLGEQKYWEENMLQCGR
jgi:hypothetical protein